MANEEHVAILKQGVEAWNEWRNAHRAGVLPNLSGADLSRVDLTGVDLSWAKLNDADLSWTNLSWANLSRANLSEANLSEANLSLAKMLRADLTGAHALWANLSGANLSRAVLHEAALNNANLPRASLIGADLTGAHLIEADLSRADLTGAHLVEADLTGAKLLWVNLSGANLSGSDLNAAVLHQAILRQAKLIGVHLYETVLVNLDLSQAIGLEQCVHIGPSVVDHHTLELSGPLPLSFLRGVGLPDRLIDYLPSLRNDATQFYSCFISYSSADHTFAERLYEGLQKKGVRCWFAPHDMPIGAKILDTILRAVRLRDKVLVILSANSITSEWVEHEVMASLDEERKYRRTILFPIRLDDAVLSSQEAWADLLRRERHIGDFTRWEDHDAYQKAFERLLRDLKKEEPLAGDAGGR